MKSTDWYITLPHHTSTCAMGYSHSHLHNKHEKCHKYILAISEQAFDAFLPAFYTEGNIYETIMDFPPNHICLLQYFFKNLFTYFMYICVCVWVYGHRVHKTRGTDNCELPCGCRASVRAVCAVSRWTDYPTLLSDPLVQTPWGEGWGDLSLRPVPRNYVSS